ncbi:MAG: glycosyltransferase [Candidatus Hydrogenedentes bacterium]|jgi:glycosyltransferase involved in cell wall biosynthesis|nr:glycosyltransferase [Candidatus Hydrogenedentota bacterium]
MKKILASIIIPVYNRHDDLHHVLNQLAAQECLDFEVVIVDDGSEPPIRFDTGSAPYPLRVLRHETRCGIGKARNSGVLAAAADVLVFVDSDGDIFDTRWFEKHKDLFKQAREKAQQSGKAGCVLHSEVVGISRGYWGRTDSYSNWFGSTTKRPGEIADRHVPTHNTATERRVFDVVGLFNESLELCEDVEWAFRCLEAGVGLFLYPGAPVGHYDRNTFRGMWQHYYRFGLYTLKARNTNKRSPYGWLFPRTIPAAMALLLITPTLMSVYVTWQWLKQTPKILWYLPGLYLANLASYLGMCRSLMGGKP